MSKEVKKVSEQKKSKSLKSAIVLFGAVLITTSLLGGTLAKYVSDIGSAEDKARVAKWYVGEEVKEFDLFADSYLNATTNTKGEWAADNATVGKLNSVQSGAKDNKVIAPGTKGSAKLEISAEYTKKDNTVVKRAGEDEVAFKYVYEVDGTDSLVAATVLDVPFYKTAPTDKISAALSDIPNNPTSPAKPTGWFADENASNKYDLWLPLKFNITDGNGTVLYPGLTNGDTGIIQVQKLREFISKASSGTIFPTSSNAEVNAAIATSTLTIDWEWPFEQGSKIPANKLGDGTEIWTKDAADTQLGFNATGFANGKGTGDQTEIPKFILKIKAKKVQVD